MFLFWSIITWGPTVSSEHLVLAFVEKDPLLSKSFNYLVKRKSSYSLTASSLFKGTCEETTSPRSHWCQPLCSSCTGLLVTPCQHPAASRRDSSPYQHHHPSSHKPASHNYQSKQWMHGWCGAQTACC